MFLLQNISSYPFNAPRLLFNYLTWNLYSCFVQEKISEDLRATLNAFLYRTGEQSNKYKFIHVLYKIWTLT